MPLQGNATLLAWQRTLFKLNLLDVLSRHDDEPDIAAVPRHRRRGIARLLYRFPDSLSRGGAILVSQSKNDIAVLERVNTAASFTAMLDGRVVITHSPYQYTSSARQRRAHQRHGCAGSCQ